MWPSHPSTPADSGPTSRYVSEVIFNPPVTCQLATDNHQVAEAVETFWEGKRGTKVGGVVRTCLGPSEAWHPRFFWLLSDGEGTKGEIFQVERRLGAGCLCWQWCCMLGRDDLKDPLGSAWDPVCVRGIPTHQWVTAVILTSCETKLPVAARKRNGKVTEMLEMYKGQRKVETSEKEGRAGVGHPKTTLLFRGPQAPQATNRRNEKTKHYLLNVTVVGCGGVCL